MFLRSTCACNKEVEIEFQADSVRMTLNQKISTHDSSEMSFSALRHVKNYLHEDNNETGSSQLPNASRLMHLTSRLTC